MPCIDKKVIEKIRNVIKNNSKVKKIILFGSRAKNTAKNGSDIDIALIGDNIGFRDLCSISSEIEELDLPYKIDIVNLNDLENNDLKEHIKRVGIEL